MIAEQIPARLVPDVIKNTAVKIVHRLPAADDREAVGATINATPAQSRYLVTLPPGQAAAFADGMDFPVLVKVNDGTRRERARPATSDPRALVRSRAASCGSECTGRPCTLREMRRAQQALEDEPWIGRSEFDDNLARRRRALNSPPRSGHVTRPSATARRSTNPSATPKSARA